MKNVSTEMANLNDLNKPKKKKNITSSENDENFLANIKNMIKSKVKGAT